jgi:hypothetical protein
MASPAGAFWALKFAGVSAAIKIKVDKIARVLGYDIFRMVTIFAYLLTKKS